MIRIRKNFLLLVFIFFCFPAFGGNVRAQTADLFLGVKLRPEVQAVAREITRKTGKPIYSDFLEQRDFQLGSSYVSNHGAAVVLIDFSLQTETEKLEAVIAHELLHLRLRLNDYPIFVFAPSVNTAKGRAVDVEQPNITDLNALIEHRIFKPEMERFGLLKFVNLAGDTAAQAARRKGEADSQSDAINYARAILEYETRADIEAVEKIYAANKWTRSLRIGAQIADLIKQANLQTPAAVEAVFLRCLSKLYPSPRATSAFVLTGDSNYKTYRRMIIGNVRRRK